MAVAVKNSPDKTTTPAVSVAAASLGGAVYVLLAVAAVFVGVPILWENVAPLLGSLTFVSAAGRLIVQVVVAVLLGLVGVTLAGPSSRPGIKGGAFAVAFGVLAIALVTCLIGQALEKNVFAAAEQRSLGTAVTWAIAGALAVGGWVGLTRADANGGLAAFEHQGWFSWNQVKPSQGRRVRRATMLGLLLILGCGIYTLISTRMLDGLGRHAMLAVPFTGGFKVMILPDVKLTLPLLLTAASVWLSYRVVNVPTFADFLIATEGELNKVSWPTKKGLVQDTIVVLVTVFLMTAFLFVIDVAWGYILSHPFVGVLRVTTDKPAETKTVDQLDW